MGTGGGEGRWEREEGRRGGGGGEGGEGGEGERKRGGGGKEAEELVFRGRTGLRDGPWSVRMCSLAVECVLLL